MAQSITLNMKCTKWYGKDKKMKDCISIEWTTKHCVHITKGEIQEMADACRAIGKYSEDYIEQLINEWVSGLDDVDFYAWTEEATTQVLNAVLQEMNGVQLSMFD